VIALLRKGWGAITGARDWLTLIALAAAAAYLYAQFATVQHERDQLRTFAGMACAAAGSSYDVAQISVKAENGQTKTAKVKPGAVCLARARELAAFERDTNSETARILAEAFEEQRRKAGLDAAHARRAAEAAAAAAERMEEADAAIKEDDRVGPAWFDALNGVAGLRPPAR
jgi:hypothetical protein